MVKLILIFVTLVAMFVDRSTSQIPGMDNSDFDFDGFDLDDIINAVESLGIPVDVPTPAPNDTMNGTRCYQCGFCVDPSEPSDCPATSNTCLTATGLGTVVRTCGGADHPVGCSNFSFLGVVTKICYCRGDLCNGNDDTTSSTIVPNVPTVSRITSSSSIGSDGNNGGQNSDQDTRVMATTSQDETTSGGSKIDSTKVIASLITAIAVKILT